MDRTTMVLSSLLQPAAVASSVVPVNNNNNNSCAHKKKKQQWRQDDHANGSGSVAPLREEEEQESSELRRGPWSVDEDLLLVNYISTHGEGRWNSLARSAGLKRTGKSCRLRWLNYLRPDVRRGNITPEEQLLILDLHSRWGNRWSKIAQQLPGRTDNEIKNYWRTRVQKHAKQLRCDVNSKQFKDLMRYLWIPRLLERIRSSRHNSSTTTADRGSDMDSGKEQSSSSSISISSNDNLLQVQDGAGGSKETMQQQLASDVSYEHLDDLSLWSGVELQLPESLWSHEDDDQLW